jgi:predicted nucleotidyltransferase
LSTKLGPLDLLGEVAGGGTYEQLILDADKTEIAGASCLVVNLEALIQLKKAAGRPKDLEAIAELERIRDGRF